MKAKSYAIPALIALSLLMFTVGTGLAADGATGSVDLDQTSMADNTLVFVHFEDLTVSADYLVNWTGDDTGFSFTTGANQDDIYIPIKFEKPAGSNAFIVHLRAGTGTAIDSVTVYVTEATTFLDTAAFLAIVVPLLIFSIVVVIYKSITRQGGR